MNMSLPLLPPPPLPPQHQPDSGKSEKLPPPKGIECPPKVESLSDLIEHLQSDELSESFDKNERRNLMKEKVGQHIYAIIQNCGSHQKNLSESQKIYKKNKTEQQKEILVSDKNQYQNCLAAISCPERYRAFRACWSRLPPNLLNEFEQHRATHLLCQSERQGVQGCAGNIVSRGVRAAMDMDGS